MILNGKRFSTPRTLGALAILILAGCTSNKKNDAPVKNPQANPTPPMAMATPMMIVNPTVNHPPRFIP